jgi:hypothetical protein
MHERSCTRAAERTDFRDAALFDFGAIDFGPDNESPRVPSTLGDMTFDEVALEVGVSPGALGSDYLFPPIMLEQGDGLWKITELDWYFQP